MLNQIRQLWKSSKASLRRYTYSHALPSIQKHNDIYLVEFPKSGVTWLSFIIANISLLMSGEKYRTVTFYNINQYIPDIHQSNNISYDPILLFPGFRFIKSHSDFNPFYRNTILLLRNPFDVMVSYYHYQVGNKSFHGNIDQFVRSSRYGVSQWLTHTNSWLKRTINIAEMRMHLLLYENLKKDTISTINELCLNIGIKIPADIIQASIERSDFNNMKKSNQMMVFHNPVYNRSFVRRGAASGFKEEMTSETMEFVYNKSEKYIKLYWPDLL